MAASNASRAEAVPARLRLLAFSESAELPEVTSPPSGNAQKSKPACLRLASYQPTLPTQPDGRDCAVSEDG